MDQRESILCNLYHQYSLHCFHYSNGANHLLACHDWVYLLPGILIVLKRMVYGNAHGCVGIYDRWRIEFLDLKVCSLRLRQTKDLRKPRKVRMACQLSYHWRNFHWWKFKCLYGFSVEANFHPIRVRFLYSGRDIDSILAIHPRHFSLLLKMRHLLLFGVCTLSYKCEEDEWRPRVWKSSIRIWDHPDYSFDIFHFDKGERNLW